MTLQDSIWYEKHRPDSLKQLVLPREYYNTFRKYIRTKQIPHLLFYGPAGSGKTTLAMILIKHCASAKLILNASSDDRGIATIKKKVKQFARTERVSKTHLNIVLLDEADGLTSEAQQALKGTMEKYHKNCRFILTANEFDKITDPIASRCMLFKFDSVPKDTLTAHLTNILDEEEIKYKLSGVVDIIDRFYPDVRTIVNNLQMGSISGRLKLTNAMIPLFDGQQLFELLDGGHIGKIRKMIAGMTDYVWTYKLLFNEYIKECPKDARRDIAITIGKYLHHDATIADREINFVACLCEILEVVDKDVYF